MFSLHVTIQNALINEPISTFNTRKPSYRVCSLLVWLFNLYSPQSLFHIRRNEILSWHRWWLPTTTYVRPRPRLLLLQIKATTILTSCQKAIFQSIPGMSHLTHTTNTLHIINDIIIKLLFLSCHKQYQFRTSIPYWSD